MPERPDLEYVVPLLDEALRGRTIEAVRVGDPVVLRLCVEGEPAALLVGRRFGGVARRGHFVCLDLEGELEVVVAPMLAGRFALADPSERAPRDVVLTFGLSDGRELRYRDDVRMGKVYVLPRGAWHLVPGLSEIGVDVLSLEFTPERLRSLAAGRREQIKLFLMDKSALDSLGNAYADEVMFAAGLHPKTRVNRLSEPEIARLRDAIVSVLTAARDEIARRGPAPDEKLRDFLKVRNRKGQPCGVCGAKIRAAGVRGHDAFFCPTCQPDRAGTGFIDWRKVGK